MFKVAMAQVMFANAWDDGFVPLALASAPRRV